MVIVLNYQQSGISILMGIYVTLPSDYGKIVVDKCWCGVWRDVANQISNIFRMRK